MISQILRFTLPYPQTISSPEFRRLREIVSKVCISQYYGYTISAPLPRMTEEICWAIHWPTISTPAGRAATLGCSTAEGSVIGDNATSLLLEIDDDKASELIKAFEARVCEFAFIALSQDAPRESIDFQASMHKTYTDTYGMRGFEGGQWAYCSNTNDSLGDKLGSENVQLTSDEKRLGVYVLGWESVELHQAATKTALFAKEIDKLAPYFGPGSGAFYVYFRKHSNDDHGGT
ncbi:hypothetical protein H2204_007897 [Knufia peltigerae]|uniref:Uncharacterized protein n=1 Tax=Knufia peltigerae TaxID=1002370 RepID=A0AA39CVA6_9EURO|nr:hypothetical protein H2204_007897 [Knufia peltigerae]